MPYIERGNANMIVGLYQLRQKGRAEEHVQDDHPDVVMFRGRKNPSDLKRVTLRKKANNTPITVKDLKDIGIL